MSTDAEAHLAAGLAKGITIEDLLAAVQVLLANTSSQSTTEPALTISDTDTLASLEEHSEEDPYQARNQPAMHHEYSCCSHTRRVSSGIFPDWGPNDHYRSE